MQIKKLKKPNKYSLFRFPDKCFLADYSHFYNYILLLILSNKLNKHLNSKQY